MAKLLASSQITIVDLNDAVSLRSYIGCSHPRVQYLSNNGTYVPDYSDPRSHVLLTADLTKLGDNTNLVQHPGTSVSRVDWYVKLAPSQEYTKITPEMTEYELVGKSPFYTGLKIKKNIMNAEHPGVTFKFEADFKEAWMPEPHTQITEIDLTLTIQGSDGVDSYTAILTNPSHTVICTPEGNADAGEIGPDGRALSDTIAYKGTKMLTAVADNPKQGQYAITLEPQNCQAVKKDNDTFYISSLSSPNALIEKTGKLESPVLQAKNVENGGLVKVTFNLEGQTTLEQVMTFSKVYNGANGADGEDGKDGQSAQYVTLTVKEGSTVFKYDKNSQTPNVSRTVLAASIYNVEDPKYAWSYFASNSWTPIEGQTGSELIVNATDDYFNKGNAITFKCTVNGNLSDEMTITKLVDGNDSIVIQQSNESHVIACNADGSFKPGEIDRAINEITAYRGLEELEATDQEPTGNQFKVTVEPNSDIQFELKTNIIKITNMTADSSALVINVKCDGKTFKKIMSVSKSKDGKNGEGTYVAVLTNEYHALPATSDGTVTSYDGCNTSIEVYKGTQLIQEGIQYSAEAGVGITGELVGNTYTVSGLTVDTANVVMKATIDGSTYSKVFTVAKNKQGSNGTDSTSYWLLSSNSTLFKDKSGTLKPNQVTFTAKSQTGQNPLKDYSGIFKIYKSTDGVIFGDADYTSSKAETNTTYGVSDSNLKALKCELYLADGRTLIDTQTINVVTDGRDGQNGADAKYVKIAGEQTFVYGPGFKGVPTPATITVTRTLYNTSGGKWQYHNGTEWTDFSPAQTGATLEVTPTTGHFANSGNKVMRIRFMVSSTVYDEMSIAKLADGQSGTDAFTILLTNPSHTVNADYNGNVTNLNTAVTEIIVYKGTKVVKPTLVGQESVVPEEATFNIEQASASTNAKVTMTNFPNTADNATCTLNITVEGNIYKQTFSVSKAKQGMPGESAKTVFVTGKQIFKYTNASPDPEGGTKITLTAVETNFTATSRKWYADGAVIQSETGTNLVVDHKASYWGDKTHVTFKYVADGIYDEITITKLYDGTDTYSVLLTNESQVLAADHTGKVLPEELKKARTKVRVFKGAQELSASNSLGGGKFTISTPGSMADGSGTCEYITKEENDKADEGAHVGVQLTSFTKDSGQVPITITMESDTHQITKIFSISKSKSGAAGAAAKVIQITGASSIIEKSDGTYEPSNGVVLSIMKKNTTGTVVWSGDGVAGGTKGDSYTVPVSSFNGRKLVTIRAEIEGEPDVYDIQVISKVSDGVDSMTSYIWGPQGTLINNSNVSSLDVEAVVMSGASNITQDASVKYHWEKKVGDHWVDLKGTTGEPIAGNNGGYKVTVGQDDIPGMLVVKCTMKHNSITQTDTIVLEDRNDPVQAIIFSTAGTTFKNGVGETFLVAKANRNGVDMDSIRLVQNVPSDAGVQGEIVYVKSEFKYYKYNNSSWEALINAPSAGDNSTYTYKWTKADSSGNLVAGWNKTGKVLYVNSEDIEEKAVFMVDVEG